MLGPHGLLIKAGRGLGDLLAVVKELFREGLNCDPVPHPVALERLWGRGHQPGLVKVELRSVKEKVAVLWRKSKLRNHDHYQRVYLWSYTEQLLDFNFRTLLRETPAGTDFYLMRNGRLVK